MVSRQTSLWEGTLTQFKVGILQQKASGVRGGERETGQKYVYKHVVVRGRDCRSVSYSGTCTVFRHDYETYCISL